MVKVDKNATHDADSQAAVGAQSGEGARKTCRCGHDRDHYMVTVDKEYSAGGWFTVLFGISTVPSKVKLRCTLCGEVLEELTDPAALKKHIR